MQRCGAKITVVGSNARGKSCTYYKSPKADRAAKPIEYVSDNYVGIAKSEPEDITTEGNELENNEPPTDRVRKWCQKAGAIKGMSATTKSGDRKRSRQHPSRILLIIAEAPRTANRRTVNMKITKLLLSVGEDAPLEQRSVREDGPLGQRMGKGYLWLN
ncbi:Protein of unknown function [Pyronema omphalodes CBS 100304]|uniref:Uncharacterized protein n=1 Tax=Pyronema omphalodes (strain CBS 100304) TaxID=1076935 RepID=U4LVE1_PYROM|nr:Protein of unknown function [Pyronema omphalodes CBS 100304]